MQQCQNMQMVRWNVAALDTCFPSNYIAHRQNICQTELLNKIKETMVVDLLFDKKIQESGD